MRDRQNDFIKGGIYLVIDPSMAQHTLFERLKQVLEVGVSAVQIWDHWERGVNKELMVTKLCALCLPYQVPVFINNDWTLLNSMPLAGVHFDAIPLDYAAIKSKIKHPFLVGLTCNNEIEEVSWAMENKVNYLSFCSMFPSQTSTSCALVSFETVERAREITDIPIFLAGGVTLSTLDKLSPLDFDGIALISGIMHAQDPGQAVRKYVKKLATIKQKSAL